MGAVQIGVTDPNVSAEELEVIAIGILDKVIERIQKYSKEMRPYLSGEL